MEEIGVWVAAVAAVAGIGSAVFAFVQARATRTANKSAEAARDEARTARDESGRLAAEANAAFTRQAEAQEEANRLERIKMTPPDWTGPVRVADKMFRVTNTSGTMMHVTNLAVSPTSAAGMVRFRRVNKDGVYEPGDVIEYASFSGLGGSAEKLEVTYRRAGTETERTLRITL